MKNIYDTDYGNNIKSICIDPSNNKTIYLSDSSNLHKSTDSGSTWEKLNSESFYALHVDSQGIIYTSGEYTLIVSSDGGSTWTTYKYDDGMVGKVMRNCISFDEQNKILYLGTRGSGILSMDFGETTNIVSNNKMHMYHYSLSSNYPNPFNQQTAIGYTISFSAPVKMKIDNTLGQLVNTLVHENKQQGEYKIIWDGKDSTGKDVPSGVYFYRLKAGDFSEVKKMILLR